MNTQEIFNKVVNHLLTQKAASRNPSNNECVYRNDNGLKCAVGVLIDYEHYKLALEKRSIRSPLVISAVADSIGRNLTENEIDLLDRLQRMHDLKSPAVWERTLGTIAEYYGLAMPPLTTNK